MNVRELVRNRNCVFGEDVKLEDVMNVLEDSQAQNIAARDCQSAILGDHFKINTHLTTISGSPPLKHFGIQINIHNKTAFYSDYVLLVNDFVMSTFLQVYVDVNSYYLYSRAPGMSDDIKGFFY